jgi:small subunit ribosomal protein S9
VVEEKKEESVENTAPETPVEEKKEESVENTAPETPVEEPVVEKVAAPVAKKSKPSDKDVFRGTGRRKESVARIYLKAGDGKMAVNKRELNEYFAREVWRRHIVEPLVLTEKQGAMDFKVNVHGGGMTGQAGAIRHALARALVKFDETLRPTLRKAGCLTRDSRMVERKKPGQPGARKRFQYSKR